LLPPITFDEGAIEALDRSRARLLFMNSIAQDKTVSKRTVYLISLLLAACSVYFLCYTAVISVDVAFLPWFSHLGVIEKYFNGTLHGADLIQRAAEHGLFGYNLVLLLNLRFFHLNTLFDSYLNAVVVTGVGVMTASVYLKTVPSTPTSRTSVLYFVPIAIALFSISQGSSSGGMETQVRLGTISIFLAIILVDRALAAAKQGRRRISVADTTIAATCILGSVLLFGTLYTFAWFPVFAVMCASAFFKTRPTRYYSALVLGTLVLSIPAYFWFYSLTLHVEPGSLSFLDRGQYIIQSVLASLSSATLGRTLWEMGLITSNGLMLVNGTFVALAYGYSLWLWFRFGMARVTWLPVALMASSVGVAFLVALGRMSLGWTWGTSYWYAVHTKFGLAGCLWIYAYIFSLPARPENSPEQSTNSLVWAQRLGAAITAIFVTSVGVSNIADWRRAPDVRSWLEAKVAYALSPAPRPVDQNGETAFNASAADTEEALRIYRRYGLTFYRSSPRSDEYDSDVVVNGKAGKGTRLGLGWYGPEGNQRWIAGDSDLAFRTGPSGVISVEGYIPSFLAPNVIDLLVDGNSIASKHLEEGRFFVEAVASPNAAVALHIRLTKHLIPRDIGLSNDQRDLGAVIVNIRTQ